MIGKTREVRSYLDLAPQCLHVAIVTETVEDEIHDLDLEGDLAVGHADLVTAVAIRQRTNDEVWCDDLRFSVDHRLGRLKLVVT